MDKGDRTHQTILGEATNLASLIGLHGLSIGTLASHAGMSKSGLFRHFGSKEQLQLEVLQSAVDRFTETVIRPALKAPRGLARVEALFGGWLDWGTGGELPGGCIFIAAAAELDDQPGPLRDYLVTTQRSWLEVIEITARKGIETGDFRPDLDPAQFAFEFNAILLGFHQANRLMRDADAPRRARQQFDRLLRDARHAPTPA